MKDTSIFQGFKELGDFRIENQNFCLRIYKKQNNSFIYYATIMKINRESNKSLHKRCESANQ